MTAPTAAYAQAHRGATGTERAAQRKAARTAGGIRGRLLSAVVQAGERGLTVFEALDALGMPERRRYSVAPRFPELVHEGLVVKSRMVRDDAAAYVATDAGRAWAEERAA